MNDPIELESDFARIDRRYRIAIVAVSVIATLAFIGLVIEFCLWRMV